MSAATLQEGEKVTLGGLEWDVISVYSRADALADGTLIDVSADAKRWGWKIPVAISCGVWGLLEMAARAHNLGLVEIDDDGELVEPACPADALDHLLLAAAQKARQCAGENRFTFRPSVLGIPAGREIVCAVGGGDDGEPVLTIMFPEEN